MTNPILTSTEDALLSERNIIETVFSRLKNWGAYVHKNSELLGMGFEYHVHIGNLCNPTPPNHNWG